MSAARAERVPDVLLTSTTGYVGGRLLRVLIEAGARVRCLTRHPEHLQTRVPTGVEVVRGDVLEPASLPAALAGVDTAYYLVHGMAAGSAFKEGARPAPPHSATFAERPRPPACAASSTSAAWATSARTCRRTRGARGGPGAGRGRHSGGRTPGLHRDRVGQPVLRDDQPPWWKNACPS